MQTNELADTGEHPEGNWQKHYRDMQQFTFALSHDLKNSLTRLKLALSLAREEEMSPSVESYISIMHRATDRLEDIMLSLNKIIRLGDSSPDVVKKINPAQAFDDICDDFADRIAKTGAIIGTDFSLLPSITYIEIFIKSIFSNLLDNAIKYRSPERQLHIRVTGSSKDNKLVLTFSDNGRGIDLTLAGSRLFLPFNRFSNDTEGSGIGLYLIKNIVERNGGNIEINSTPGKGTTFRIVLREYVLPH
jgi:signal transduction histidine kinase